MRVKMALWRCRVCANVSMNDETIARAGADCIRVPRQAADSRLMAAHFANFLHRMRVPNLQQAFLRSNSKLIAALRPLYRSDAVAFVRQIVQLYHFAVARIPQINARTQANREHILLRPIDKIQIEIVLKIGCIENLQISECIKCDARKAAAAAACLVRIARHFALRLSRRFQQSKAVGGKRAACEDRIR